MIFLNFLLSIFNNVSRGHQTCCRLDRRWRSRSASTILSQTGSWQVVSYSLKVACCPLAGSLWTEITCVSFILGGCLWTTYITTCIRVLFHLGLSALRPHNCVLYYSECLICCWLVDLWFIERNCSLIWNIVFSTRQWPWSCWKEIFQCQGQAVSPPKEVHRQRAGGGAGFKWVERLQGSLFCQHRTSVSIDTKTQIK